jgi:hypothetical protein
MGTVGHGGDIVGLPAVDWDKQNVVEQLIRDAQSRFEALYPDCVPSSPAEESPGSRKEKKT